jgi:hypothetical protein
MTTNAKTADGSAAPPRRRRRWLRRTLIALVVVIIGLVVSVELYIRFAPVPAPLAMPAAADEPAGSLPGDWEVVKESAAGFRLQQTVLFADGDVVQRTHAVTGQLTVTDTTITTATFTVDLTTLTDDGTASGQKTPQVEISLDTRNHPNATITLTRPLAVDPAIQAGTAVTMTAPADMTLRGRTHPVTISLTARRDGTLLRAAGSFPVTFADWGIPDPEEYGPLGSLADHGTGEFLLVLQHAGAIP